MWVEPRGEQSDYALRVASSTKGSSAVFVRPEAMGGIDAGAGI